MWSSGNCCYRMMQNILYSSLLSKNMEIKMYITIYFFFCGYGTWSLKLREKRRLRMLETRVLRQMFGPKKDQVTGE
jgi:hypothetical protein